MLKLPHVLHEFLGAASFGCGGLYVRDKLVGPYADTKLHPADRSDQCTLRL